MTRIIAHRANLYGPDTSNENTPRAIEMAVKRGFWAEVDIVDQEGKIHLGHDVFSIREEVPKNFYTDDKFKYRIIWHCKSIAAAAWAIDLAVPHFFHERDFAALTSSGNIWTCNIEATDKDKCIFMAESLDVAKLAYHQLVWFGICTDHAYQVRDQCMPAGFTE